MAKKSQFKLTNEQKIILQVLAQSPLRKRLYWTGGTALAYFYLHHRGSYDVDLFSDTQLALSELLPFARDAAEALSLKKFEPKRIHDRFEFIFTNGQETRLDCVWYQFPALKKRKEWKGILVDSFEDMVANKTIALMERREGKDVFDIYTLLKKKLITVPSLLELVRKKFGAGIHEETILADGLLACNKLKNIRPMLFGSEKEQEKQVLDVVNFFKDHAAQRLHSLIEDL